METLGLPAPGRDLLLLRAKLDELALDGIALYGEGVAPLLPS